MSYLLGLGRARLAGLAVLGTVAAVGSALQVTFTGQLVSNPSGDLLEPGLLWLATLVALVSVEFLTNRMVTTAAMQIRLDICRRIMGADLRTVERAGNAKLLAVLTEDVSALAQALSVIPPVATGALSVAVATTVLFFLSPSLMLVQLGIGAVVVSLAILPFRRGMQLSRLAARLRQGLVERFRLVIEGSKELKLDRARRRWNYYSALHDDAKQVRDASLVASNSYSFAEALSRVFGFLVVGVTTAVGHRFLDAPPATLVTFAITTFFLLGPIESIIGRLPYIAGAQAALERIEGANLRLASEAESYQSADQPTTFNLVELEDVGFTYESSDRRFRVGPLDFSLARGQIVFVVGANGSGKSTFAKLLCGLYPNTSGTITLDGNEINDSNRDSFRQLFSAIFVDPCLFPEIGSSLEVVDEARASELLAEFGLSELVKLENGRFSTTALSTGQRKRLALVAASLRDPAIFLFDEWAADQDPSFRRVFYRKLLPELRARGKTVVAITHDEAYFDAADVVIKFEDGKIVNESTRMFMARLMGSSS